MPRCKQRDRVPLSALLLIVLQNSASLWEWSGLRVLIVRLSRAPFEGAAASLAIPDATLTSRECVDHLVVLGEAHLRRNSDEVRCLL